MTFNYQNDIDSKMENYPLKLHNTLTYITAKFCKENYKYIILLLTNATDAATPHAMPTLKPIQINLLYSRVHCRSL